VSATGKALNSALEDIKKQKIKAELWTEFIIWLEGYVFIGERNNGNMTNAVSLGQTFGSSQKSGPLSFDVECKG
jgi:hypothetical protein